MKTPRESCKTPEADSPIPNTLGTAGGQAGKAGAEQRAGKEKSSALVWRAACHFWPAPSCCGKGPGGATTTSCSSAPTSEATRILPAARPGMEGQEKHSQEGRAAPHALCLCLAASPSPALSKLCPAGAFYPTQRGGCPPRHSTGASTRLCCNRTEVYVTLGSRFYRQGQPQAAGTQLLCASSHPSGRNTFSKSRAGVANPASKHPTA